jgi:hypothetical protein
MARKEGIVRAADGDGYRGNGHLGLSQPRQIQGRERQSKGLFTQWLVLERNPARSALHVLWYAVSVVSMLVIWVMVGVGWGRQDSCRANVL